MWRFVTHPNQPIPFWSIWNPVRKSQALTVDRICVSFQFFLTQQHRHAASWLELWCLLLCYQDDTPTSSHPRESWHPPGLFLSMLPLLLNLRKDGVGWRVRRGRRRPTPPAVSQADFCPKERCNLILQSCWLQNPTLSIGPGEECLDPALLVYPSRTCSDAQSPGQTESLPVTRNSPLPNICPCLAYHPLPPLQCSHSRPSTCMSHPVPPQWLRDLPLAIISSKSYITDVLLLLLLLSRFSCVQLRATP